MDHTFVTEEFWKLADITKLAEKYKVDKNLQYLQIAPLNILRKIFIQYRFFTHYYIADMAILISKLPFGNLRTLLAEILHEELGGGNSNYSHPQLYDKFLISIGISAVQLNNANQKCLTYLKSIQTSLKNKSWAYGIGLRGMGGECLCQLYLSAMYDYFSKNLAIVAMHKHIAWKFWEIHIGEIDLHHQHLIRTAINELIITHPETASELLDGYKESQKAWNSYWAQIFKSTQTDSFIHVENNYV